MGCWFGITPIINNFTTTQPQMKRKRKRKIAIAVCLLASDKVILKKVNNDWNDDHV